MLGQKEDLEAAMADLRAIVAAGGEGAATARGLLAQVKAALREATFVPELSARGAHAVVAGVLAQS